MPGTMVTSTSDPALWTAIKAEYDRWGFNVGFVVYGPTKVHYQVFQRTNGELGFVPWDNDELSEDTTNRIK